ncbi:TPA: hypothetical protein HA278_05860 [Candidatus Woesearchaeota archaeon]|nr:hypothetical protein [archaeon]HIJ11556.1 hypothetical protein [Candidatus Woesearchaeota archaeon]
MGFWQWHEGLVRRISPRNISMILLGKLLVSFSISSAYSRFIIPYGFVLLLIGSVVVFHYVHATFMRWHENKETEYKHHMFGLIGILLLAIFIGAQSSHVPLKLYIGLLGVVLTIPGLIDLFRSGEKLVTKKKKSK